MMNDAELTRKEQRRRALAEEQASWDYITRVHDRSRMQNKIREMKATSSAISDGVLSNNELEKKIREMRKRIENRYGVLQQVENIPVSQPSVVPRATGVHPVEQKRNNKFSQKEFLQDLIGNSKFKSLKESADKAIPMTAHDFVAKTREEPNPSAKAGSKPYRTSSAAEEVVLAMPSQAILTKHLNNLKAKWAAKKGNAEKKPQHPVYEVERKEAESKQEVKSENVSVRQGYPVYADNGSPMFLGEPLTSADMAQPIEVHQGYPVPKPVFAQRQMSHENEVDDMRRDTSAIKRSNVGRGLIVSCLVCLFRVESYVSFNAFGALFMAMNEHYSVMHAISMNRVPGASRLVNQDAVMQRETHESAEQRFPSVRQSLAVFGVFSMRCFSASMCIHSVRDARIADADEQEKNHAAKEPLVRSA